MQLVGLQTKDYETFAVGDMIHIEFRLDDRRKSEINRGVIIVHVGDDRRIGGRFIKDIYHLYDKPIGFYLMP